MFRKKLLYFFVLISGITLFVPQDVNGFTEQLLEVHFIDVGQGDSIYIKTPENKHILIDGGPPDAGKNVVKYLNEQNVKTVDLLIATHPHYDHIGGLIDVIEQFSIKQVVHTGIIHPTKTYFMYMYQIWKQAIPIYIPSKNERLLHEPNVGLEVVNSDFEHETVNNASLVLKLNYDDVRFLLLGDLEREAEYHLLQTDTIKADIIKIAHHGSKTSSSFDFLQRVNPEVAILTYGRDNKYGHPNNRVIENINFLDTFIYSTATFGSIVVATNGKQFYVTPTSNPLERALQSN